MRPAAAKRTKSHFTAAVSGTAQHHAGSTAAKAAGSRASKSGPEKKKLLTFRSLLRDEQEAVPRPNLARTQSIPRRFSAVSRGPLSADALPLHRRVVSAHRAMTSADTEKRRRPALFDQSRASAFVKKAKICRCNDSARKRC